MKKYKQISTFVVAIAMSSPVYCAGGSHNVFDNVISRISITSRNSTPEFNIHLSRTPIASTTFVNFKISNASWQLDQVSGPATSIDARLVNDTLFISHKNTTGAIKL